MKLKSSLQLALVAGMASFALSAQAQGGYVKLGGAYNMGVGGDIGYNSTSNQVYNNNGQSTYKANYERVDMNLGKGISAGGTLGYMFSPNIGAEIGVNYLLGSKTEMTSTGSESIPSYTTTSNSSSEVYSRMLLIQPAVVISAGQEGLNPYARFGFVAGKGSVYQNSSSVYQTTTPTAPNKEEVIEELELTGGWAFGLQGGLGVDLGITDNLSLFAEVTLNNLKYSPDKGEITKLTVNGKDELNTQDTQDKEAEFVNEYEENSTDTSSADEPAKEPKFNLPFGSAGFGLGLKFNF